MDDVGNLREKEVMLPDHSGNVACSNINMTSIDSGVETGNDSNDSSTVQQEGQQQQTTSHVMGYSGVTAVDSSGEFSKVVYDPNWRPLIHSLFVSEEVNPIIGTGNSHLAAIKSLLQQSLLQQSPVYKERLIETKMDMYKSKMSLKSEICRRKVSQCLWRKGMPLDFSLSDWQAARIQRRMRLAATTNNITAMKRLLASGVSPNNHDDHGRTPLHISACRGYTEMVCLLLEYGADPNQRDCIGNTPLHLATVNSKLSVVIPLLTAGTDVLALDSYGYNPLQLAKTKLGMLQRNCNNEDMLKVKEEMHLVINMLMLYLRKQKNMREQVETLSNFCSRLSLSNTSDQVQDDVKNLLANINALNITG